MKKTFILIFSLSLLLGHQACRNEQKTGETATAPAEEQVAADAASGPVSERLQALGLTGQGHWRGISLGDSLAVVKRVETAKLFESDASHLGYSIEFPNMESVDMLYYQKDQKVSGIDVDLYLNTRQSVIDYTTDLKQYFSARYGQSAANGAALGWTGTQEEKISVKDVSEGKDFGIKIKISAAGNAAESASARR